MKKMKNFNCITKLFCTNEIEIRREFKAAAKDLENLVGTSSLFSKWERSL
jgi:hypothetical protein